MMYDPALILTPDNRNAVVEYLCDLGHHAASLNLLSGVELANLYHEAGGGCDP